jgi:hypothetical protein
VSVFAHPGSYPRPIARRPPGALPSPLEAGRVERPEEILELALGLIGRFRGFQERTPEAGPGAAPGVPPEPAPGVPCVAASSKAGGRVGPRVPWNPGIQVLSGGGLAAMSGELRPTEGGQRVIPLAECASGHRVAQQAVRLGGGEAAAFEVAAPFAARRSPSAARWRIP